MRLTAKRMEFWKGEVSSFISSGQSVAQFSKDKPYCSRSLSVWVRRLGDSVKESDSVKFAKVQVQSATKAVRTSSLPDPEWVARLILALGAER